MPRGVEDEDVAEADLGATTSRQRDGHDANTAPEPSRTSLHEPTSKTTIVLKTHDGDGYVLPYLPWDASSPSQITIKLHIEEIYRLRRRENLAEAVKDGKFSMLTENGDIILPSLWQQVVEPSAIVHVSISSEILGPGIASYYPYEDEVRPTYRPRSPSVVHSNDGAIYQQTEDAEDSVENDKDDSTGSDEDLDTKSDSSGSETSESPAPTEVPVEVARPVLTPTDDDGNSLTFQVNTAFLGPLDQATANANDLSNKREPQQSIGNAEYLSIAKAVSTQADGRTSLQIHVLQGPRATFMQLDISIRWFHLHSERLDLASFKETCLCITGLSGRLQKLVKKLFDRVEKDKLKIFLGGMFIEPGTVLRVDESHQSDPQSVTFSCIPYFDLQTPAKKMPTTGQTMRFPPRTLMQSYYPYEPVQDRDEEQAYRKFGNEQRDALVHVPNMWMVNIGPNIVATCAHQALSKGFVQSIQVVDVSRSHTEDEENQTTNIRLTDWDGHKLLYTVGECRSYFQMEQKLRELRWCSSRSRYEKSLQLSWQTSNGCVVVTPGLWAGILRQKNALFIDLDLLNDTKRNDKNDVAARLPSSTVSPPNPFFHWPQTTGANEVKTDGLISDEIKRSIQCLEYVEKAMMSEVLSNSGSYGAVERTFTSTVYYRTLPQNTAEQVRSSLASLPATDRKLKDSQKPGIILHQTLVTRQHDTIAKKTFELYECMHKTLALFVVDVDESTMLRKSWAAMKSICDIAITAWGREPLIPDVNEQSDSKQARRSAAQRGWFVRPDISPEVTSAPSKKLKRTFRRCRKCSETEMYSTSQAALLHLQKHLKHLDASESDSMLPEQWIINYTQMKMEVWNEGTVAILTRACQTAQRLFNQAQELSDGVRNEDGQMSDLYTFPRPLLSAFRQLLIFYFAIERAMFYTEDSFKEERNVFEGSEYMTTLPFSSGGLQVIEAFGNGVQQALASARNELCSMVKSAGSTDISSRLSLSPEYVCSWFMRRLIVKPLEKSMTVSDMYREYLSTIQFQVNHRPGKRLLHSINLLQEEIAALQEVNTQQSKLISNYTSVLDDATYEKDIASRRAMFPYERMLLESCQDSLKMTDQEYRYLLARCGPLSESTKQSLEINEEDHGKAILVFTIVTVIFLPLSFVTSFLGMNTTDIRDMGSSSTLFWAIAIPLTAVTMGSVLYVGYNGDDLRDTFGSMYRTITGKQDRSIGARGISVAQRKLARRSATNSNTTLDFSSLADDAEFANPRPDDYYNHARTDVARPPRRQYTLEPPTMQWEPYATAANPLVPEPRTGLHTSSYTRPNVTIYDTTRVDDSTRPTIHNAAYDMDKTYLDAEIYNEPVTVEGHRAQRRNSPPPPPQRYPPPPSLRRPGGSRFYKQYTTIRPLGRIQEEHSVPLPQYEWTKKSHRHHQSTRDGTRRRRDDRRDRWDGDDNDDWYNGAPHPYVRHVPAPRPRFYGGRDH